MPADVKRQKEVLEFLSVRLAVVLKELGYRYDIVEAVLSEQAANPAGAAAGRETTAGLGGAG